MRVLLLEPHEHGGRRYGAGEELELPERSARWLIESGVAEARKASRGRKRKREQEE